MRVGVPVRAPNIPPKAPQKIPREPQNALKHITESKTLVFQNVRISIMKPSFLKVEKAVCKLKIDTNHLREEKHKYYIKIHSKKSIKQFKNENPAPNVNH